MSDQQPQKIKVLHALMRVDAPGGAQMMLHRLVTHPSQNIEHEVVSVDHTDGPVGNMIKAAGVPVTYLGEQTIEPSEVREKVKAFLSSRETNRPDIVHIWMSPADLAFGIPASKQHYPIIWGVRDSNPYAYNSEQQLTHRANLSSKIPDIILYNSYAGQRDYEAVGMDASKGGVICNGIETDKFTPSDEKHRVFRAQHQIPEDAIVIGTAQRNHKIKDFPALVEVAKRVIAANPGRDIRFLWCGRNVELDQFMDGGGKPQRTFRQWLEEAGIASHVMCLGLLDTHTFYPGIDAYLSASKGEGMSVSLMEAMSCGVECIATDVGDTHNILGNTGYVVPPGNISALAEATNKFIHKEEKEKVAGSKAARERMVTTFNINDMLSQYESLYQQIMQSRSKWQRQVTAAKPLAGIGFDWNETLFETYNVQDPGRVAAELALTQMKREGHEVSLTYDDKYKAEGTDAFLLRALSGDRVLAERAYMIQQREYEKIFLDHARPLEGAVETLRFLKQNKIPFFVASNMQEHILKAQFRHVFGDEFSDVPIIGAGKNNLNLLGTTTLRAKPDPDLVLEGFRRIGVKPDKSNTLYIGNNIRSDTPAAVRAGVKPILFSMHDLLHDSPRENRNKPLLGKISEKTYWAEIDNRRVKLDVVSNHYELREYLAGTKQILNTPSIQVPLQSISVRRAPTGAQPSL